MRCLRLSEKRVQDSEVGKAGLELLGVAVNNVGLKVLA